MGLPVICAYLIAAFGLGLVVGFLGAGRKPAEKNGGQEIFGLEVAGLKFYPPSTADVVALMKAVGSMPEGESPEVKK